MRAFIVAMTDPRIAFDEVRYALVGYEHFKIDGLVGNELGELKLWFFKLLVIKLADVAAGHVDAVIDSVVVDHLVEFDPLLIAGGHEEIEFKMEMRALFVQTATTVAHNAKFAASLVFSVVLMVVFATALDRIALTQRKRAV